eukprot:TRINITY_DN16478_c0_g1_i2.p1 TRINITY_DN16478_c0_g1~~TRINITY_DN16478_c0_g1_i2.p1  ORF type:complete len:1710 (-),score=352.33 TRINITY_DN16478_c0_g1_i2:75-5204(-)
MSPYWSYIFHLAWFANELLFVQRAYAIRVSDSDLDWSPDDEVHDNELFEPEPKEDLPSFDEIEGPIFDIDAPTPPLPPATPSDALLEDNESSTAFCGYDKAKIHATDFTPGRPVLLRQDMDYKGSSIKAGTVGKVISVNEDDGVTKIRFQPRRTVTMAPQSLTALQVMLDKGTTVYTLQAISVYQVMPMGEGKWKMARSGCLATVDQVDTATGNVLVTWEVSRKEYARAHSDCPVLKAWIKPEDIKKLDVKEPMSVLDARAKDMHLGWFRGTLARIVSLGRDMLYLRQTAVDLEPDDAWRLVAASYGILVTEVPPTCFAKLMKLIPNMPTFPEAVPEFFERHHDNKKELVQLIESVPDECPTSTDKEHVTSADLHPGTWVVLKETVTFKYDGGKKKITVKADTRGVVMRKWSMGPDEINIKWDSDTENKYGVPISERKIKKYLYVMQQFRKGSRVQVSGKDDKGLLPPIGSEGLVRGVHGASIDVFFLNFPGQPAGMTLSLRGSLQKNIRLLYSEGDMVQASRLLNNRFRDLMPEAVIQSGWRGRIKSIGTGGDISVQWDQDGVERTVRHAETQFLRPVLDDMIGTWKYGGLHVFTIFKGAEDELLYEEWNDLGERLVAHLEGTRDGWHVGMLRSEKEHQVGGIRVRRDPETQSLQTEILWSIWQLPGSIPLVRYREAQSIADVCTTVAPLTKGKDVTISGVAGNWLTVKHKLYGRKYLPIMSRTGPVVEPRDNDRDFLAMIRATGENKALSWISRPPAVSTVAANRKGKAAKAHGILKSMKYGMWALYPQLIDADKYIIAFRAIERPRLWGGKFTMRPIWHYGKMFATFTLSTELRERMLGKLLSYSQKQLILRSLSRLSTLGGLTSARVGWVEFPRQAGIGCEGAEKRDPMVLIDAIRQWAARSTGRDAAVTVIVQQTSWHHFGQDFKRTFRHPLLSFQDWKSRWKNEWQHNGIFGKLGMLLQPIMKLVSMAGLVVGIASGFGTGIALSITDYIFTEGMTQAIFASGGKAFSAWILEKLFWKSTAPLQTNVMDGVYEVEKLNRLIGYFSGSETIQNMRDRMEAQVAEVLQQPRYKKMLADIAANSEDDEVADLEKRAQEVVLGLISGAVIDEIVPIMTDSMEVLASKEQPGFGWLPWHRWALFRPSGGGGNSNDALNKCVRLNKAMMSLPFGKLSTKKVGLDREDLERITEDGAFAFVRKVDRKTWGFIGDSTLKLLGFYDRCPTPEEAPKQGDDGNGFPARKINVYLTDEVKNYLEVYDLRAYAQSKAGFLTYPDWKEWRPHNGASDYLNAEIAFDEDIGRCGNRDFIAKGQSSGSYECLAHIIAASKQLLSEGEALRVLRARRSFTTLGLVIFVLSPVNKQECKIYVTKEIKQCIRIKDTAAYSKYQAAQKEDQRKMQGFEQERLKDDLKEGLQRNTGDCEAQATAGNEILRGGDLPSSSELEIQASFAHSDDPLARSLCDKLNPDDRHGYSDNDLLDIQREIDDGEREWASWFFAMDMKGAEEDFYLSSKWRARRNAVRKGKTPKTPPEEAIEVPDADLTVPDEASEGDTPASKWKNGVTPNKMPVSDGRMKKPQFSQGRGLQGHERHPGIERTKKELKQRFVLQGSGGGAQLIAAGQPTRPAFQRSNGSNGRRTGQTSQQPAGDGESPQYGPGQKIELKYGGGWKKGVVKGVNPAGVVAVIVEGDEYRLPSVSVPGLLRPDTR